MKGIAHGLPVALLLAAALVAGCLPGETQQPTGNAPTEYVTLGPRSFTKAADSNGYGGNNPSVFAVRDRTAFPESVYLAVSSGYIADPLLRAGNALGEIAFNSQESLFIFFGSAVPSPGAYTLVPMGGALGAGQVSLFYSVIQDNMYHFCTASGGSLNLERFGAVDGLVKGTFSVSSLATAGTGTTCAVTWPMPAAGTFRIVRSPDGRFGNDGRQAVADSASVLEINSAGAPSTASHVETNTTPNNPVLWARQTVYTDPFTLALASDTEVHFNVSANPATGTYDRMMLTNATTIAEALAP